MGLVDCISIMIFLHSTCEKAFFEHSTFAHDFGFTGRAYRLFRTRSLFEFERSRLEEQSRPIRVRRLTWAQLFYRLISGFGELGIDRH